MKILLLGADGQIGWELQRSLAVLGQVVALTRHSTDWCGDLLRPHALAQTVRTVQPQVIVNAAAFTAVDAAQQQCTEAYAINAAAPQVLAQEAWRLNACLVHYSTDYVFDGRGTDAWTEQDRPAPLSVYGQSKWLGEQHIQASGCQHLILRTSGVYSARRQNFLRTMLHLAQSRSRLQVVDDQWGAPTSAEWLADVTAHALQQVLAQPNKGGLYHCVPSGTVSWHAYAQYVIAQAQVLAPDKQWCVQDIEAISSNAYAAQAPRPLNSRLCTQRLQHTFGLPVPHWQDGVRRTLCEILRT